MTLEQQVVSLELAKRMKTLGFPQESLFAWALIKDEMEETSDYGLVYDWEITHNQGIETITAYTVAELGEIIQNIDFDNLNMKFTKEWDGIVKSLKFFEKEQRGKSEADARAKMLIYLKENNLIE